MDHDLVGVTSGPVLIGSQAPSKACFHSTLSPLDRDGLFWTAAVRLHRALVLLLFEWLNYSRLDRFTELYQRVVSGHLGHMKR